LDTGIQASTELHYDSLWVCIARFTDQIQKLVKVLVDGPLVLEIGGGLEAVDSGDVRMKRTKLLFEFLIELLPIYELIRSGILFLPSKHSGGPFSCPSCLHIRQCPYDFGLVIWEAVWTETDVRLTGVQEFHSFRTVSVKFGW
jgi:hypothetical protein